MIGLTIMVNNRPEPPDVPAVPTVTVVSSTSLTVDWSVPNNDGPLSSRPPIDDYDVRYRVGSGAYAELDDVVNSTATTATITGLLVGSTYEVQVRAGNADGNSDWSDADTATTSANQAPEFADAPGPVERAVDENSPVPTILGAPITATDTDMGDTRTYSLTGANAADFSIDSNGQVRTARVVDHELRASYNLMVVATDSHSGETMIGLTIMVNNRPEPPDVPAVPTVRVVSSTSLTVDWSVPNNDGPLSSRPPIDDYDVRYRVGSGAYAELDDVVNSTAITATITGLLVGSTYEVQVRAGNADGDSDWSDADTATTSANQAPEFADAPGPVERAVDENSPVSTILGAPITATDTDMGDTRTYSLTGANAADFSIDSNGQVRTASVVDHELRASYNLMVVATDSHSGETMIGLTIMVNNRPEPPDVPAVPTVTVVSSTSLTVDWSVPNNDGPLSSRPPIDDYDVRYRVGSGAYAELDDVVNSTATTATITGLLVGSTYEVQVRAGNADGNSDWSDADTATTSANQAPEFADAPGPVERAVDENSPVPTILGAPITATDTDMGDTRTYSLTGANAADFSIDSNGQVRTASVVDHELRASYNLMVVATDSHSGETMIGLTIMVNNMDEPPDPPVAPTVTAASLTSLTVRWAVPNNADPSSRTAITDYAVRYRAGNSGAYMVLADAIGTATTTPIIGLSPNTAYQVQVRADNAEGESAWSLPGQRHHIGESGADVQLRLGVPRGGRKQ